MGEPIAIGTLEVVPVLGTLPPARAARRQEVRLVLLDDLPWDELPGCGGKRGVLIGEHDVRAQPDLAATM
ncbi:MAG: hypothetical protein WKF96_04530 [Solirubrobacteraceae bacterium]